MTGRTRGKIIGIVEARMGSRRLPGKCMMPILGAPMLGRQLERIRRARSLDGIVVAITDREYDDPLARWLEGQGQTYYRGNERDVLGRVLACAQAQRADAICRLTGDNPLLDPEIIDSVVEEFRAGAFDFVSNDLTETFPLGLNVRVFTTVSLEKIAAKKISARDREFVTIYYYEHRELFAIKNIEATGSLRRPELRWTVDTPEDFQRVAKIYKRLYAKKSDFSARDIIAILPTLHEFL